MNPPQVYMSSPSWTLLPPPSPFHPSGSSQCTSPKHPVSCIEPGLATHFIHDILHVAMPFSQIFPPSPSPTESIRLFCTSVSEVLYLKKSLSYLSVQFSSVAKSCLTLCNPMNCSTPGLPVHHQLPEFTQTHVNQVGNAIQSSHPLLSLSPPAPNPSQHQSLVQWVNSSHEVEVAKVLEFQL